MSYHKETKSTVKNTICPICDGDGGVRGGCYKCDGTGWVTEKSRSAYHPSPRNFIGGEDSGRTSNSDYIGSHIGAHYRDRDGRFGSIPDYDEDY